MPKTARMAEIQRLHEEMGSISAVAKHLKVDRVTVRESLRRAQEFDAMHAEVKKPEVSRLEAHYDLNRPEKAPDEAWAEHRDAFERAASKVLQARWNVIERPRGPFCIFHSTDEHIDDDRAALHLIESDIAAAHRMNAVMCHGGDALNNWPMAGRLAAQWANQQCTAPDALLRLKHFITIFRPDVWTDGNHEEMNPYLDMLIKECLPDTVLRDYWTVRFVVQPESGRPCRVVMSHKFSKGSSWFHKVHGHLREMLEGEEADLLMDGHLHSDGVMDHTLPERLQSTLCIASAGYKVLDKYATRISRGGTMPKLRGRAHWIVGDDQADFDANFLTAFKCPEQAEAYLNGLQNLRAL
jgi:hypothetical protein